ncbi:Zinc finger MYND domain-containing protein 10 [Lobulomyces angularis]|nr:Zinc finger MYND domain-containing protein 10 [Lobulomyces angularis]
MKITDHIETTANLLSQQGIRKLVNEVSNVKLRDIGGQFWMDQHQILSKLNIQAHLQVQTESKEIAYEELLNQNKIVNVLHHLLSIEVWKNKIYPNFSSDTTFKEKNEFKLYFLLYHEATAINLLELLLYHPKGLNSLGENILDLIDYCNKKLRILNAWDEDVVSRFEKLDFQKSEVSKMDLKKNRSELEFSISINSLSIFRYLTENILNLSLTCQTRIINEYDFISHLVFLIEKAPWLKTKVEKNAKVFEKFDNGVWKMVDKEELFLIGKVEAQVWLSLYNLLIEPECQKKYNYNTKNHEIVLRLRTYMSEDLLNQLPILEGLYRFLEQLSMMDPPVQEFGDSKVLIQQIPDLTLSILEGADFKEISHHQKTIFECESAAAKEKFTEGLANIYNIDDLETFLEDPKCAKCGQLATQRCSRCKLEWYCSRPCQVKSWGNHKETCSIIVGDVEK